jgi:hypothetical protein
MDTLDIVGLILAPPVDFRDEDKLVMILLYNNMMKNLRELTRDTILYSNWKIANYFKKSLDIV